MHMQINMLGRKINNKLTICWKRKHRYKSATTRREETTAGITQMTASLKGSVARGRAPPPTRGGAIYYIELYGRSFTHYFSGSIEKKGFI